MFGTFSFSSVEFCGKLNTTVIKIVHAGESYLFSDTRGAADVNSTILTNAITDIDLMNE